MFNDIASIFEDDKRKRTQRGKRGKGKNRNKLNYIDSDYADITRNRDCDLLWKVKNECKIAVYELTKKQLLRLWKCINDRIKNTDFCVGIVFDIMKFRVNRYQLEDYIMQCSEDKKLNKEYVIFTYMDKCMDAV